MASREHIRRLGRRSASASTEAVEAVKASQMAYLQNVYGQLAKSSVLAEAGATV